MTETKGDCYIDVWRETHFRGEPLRIYGPAEHASLEFAQGDWGDDIGSLRVGPNAFVIAYRRRDFRDEPVAFGPNDEVADLDQLKVDDDIESLRLIDSLKIFDHLEYNSTLFPETPDVLAAGPSEPWPNPNKSKRWKGRRR